jgi:hypothetical protein
MAVSKKRSEVVPVSIGAFQADFDRAPDRTLEIFVEKENRPKHVSWGVEHRAP